MIKNLNDQKKPLVSIGLPIFNGEKFLKTRLDSLLNQTFKNFEIIISDNASCDETQKICNEYMKIDKRIQYNRQEKNIGFFANLRFVINKSQSKYFVFAPVDDIILPEFLEKNISILEADDKIVCSISNTERFVDKTNRKQKSINEEFNDFRKKMIFKFKPNRICSINGPYEQKIRILFKKSAYQMQFGVCRTYAIKKCLIDKMFVGDDVCLCLNLLKYGDVHMIDDVLLLIYDRGMSTVGSISTGNMYGYGVVNKLFPHIPLTKWCYNHLGSKLFFKNIDQFIELNLASELFVIMDIIRLAVSKTLKK